MADASSICFFRERLRRGAVGDSFSIVWLLQHLAVLRLFSSRPVVSALSMYSVVSGTLQAVSPSVDRDLATLRCCGLGRFQTGFDKEPHGNHKPIHRTTRPVLGSVDLGDDVFEQRPDFSPDVRS